jgi:hypothetical protein
MKADAPLATVTWLAGIYIAMDVVVISHTSH